MGASLLALAKSIYYCILAFVFYKIDMYVIFAHHTFHHGNRPSPSCPYKASVSKQGYLRVLTFDMQMNTNSHANKNILIRYSARSF